MNRSPYDAECPAFEARVDRRGIKAGDHIEAAQSRYFPREFEADALDDDLPEFTLFSWVELRPLTRSARAMLALVKP